MGSNGNGPPQPGRLLGILTTLAVLTAVLALVTFWPPGILEHRRTAGENGDPSQELIARWQTGLTDVVATFANNARTLRENLANLRQQIESPQPTPLDARISAAIQQRLEQHIAESLGLDWEGLAAALPPHWSYRIVAPPSATNRHPMATLTLQSLAPCRMCRTPDGCPRAPTITLSFYPSDEKPILPQTPDCQPATVATTTAYSLVDTCGNDPCDERVEIRQAVIAHWTHPPTAQP